MLDTSHKWCQKQTTDFTCWYKNGPMFGHSSLWDTCWCPVSFSWRFSHLPQIAPELKPFHISHLNGNWMSIMVTSALLVSPSFPCLPGTVIFLCMASGVFNCGGTCFIADTKAQALTSHTFSYNISSAGGIHLFVITGCIQYHCTRPYGMAQRHEKTH